LSPSPTRQASHERQEHSPMTRPRRLPDPELARVLADPTRRRVLDLVVAAPEPITVAAITDAVGLHHNAIRQHLARLCAAGLVIETREQRHTPGRPRLLYCAARTAPRDASDHYRRLAHLLLRVVQTGASARDVGRDAGRQDATSSRSTTDPVAALEHETARHGFMPTRVHRSGRVELVLNHCPIADVAADDPTTVCALHLGLAEGFLDAIGGAQVTTLTAKDPYDAGCRIRLATNDA
jgi:predicted ArsR family transcriptional regulator